MSEVDPEVVARLRGLLAGVPALEARREAALRSVPPPGSLAAEDLALDGGRFVTIYAGQTLNGAIDDLNTWRLLVSGPEVPIRAHLVLLRAALEASVRARWLVEPAVPAGERVGRAWAMRRHDQNERRKFEASLPDGGDRLAASLGPKGRTGAERVAEVDDPVAVAARSAAGIPVVPFMAPTGLFKHYGIEHIYRLLSGLSHGLEWTMAVAQLTPLDGVAETPGMGAGTFSMSEPVGMAMTELTLAAVATGVEELVRYRVGPHPLDK